MKHPELDAVIQTHPPPEVVVHLARCPRCREDRRAWRGEEDHPDPMLPVDPALSDRFELIGWLGQGGMGDVLRAYDRELEREVAIKILRADRAHGDLVARLIHEARLTARLEHPSIVPVYHSGRLRDGRPFYVMKVVRGRTLRAVLGGVEGAPPSLRRAVDLLQRVCDAVAYAHAQQIVHRDLKPENILLGDFNELTLVDFGLSSERDGLSGPRVGTAAYLPPELVDGGAPDPAADVYAIGTMLYEMLAGGPPYNGDPASVLRRLAAGPPLPLPASQDEVLVSICQRAMARESAARPTAQQLGDALRGWLDGVVRLEEARGIVHRAVDLREDARLLRGDALALRSRATLILASLPQDALPEHKAEGWALQDGAAATLLRADALDMQYEQQLMAAMTRWPGLPEARQALAGHWRDRLLDAEHRRDLREVARYEALLREDGTLASWLDADVPFQLETEPAGIRVTAERYVSRTRRLVPVDPIDLGATPLRRSLGTGSWRLTLGEEHRVMPLFIERDISGPTLAPQGRTAVHRLPDRIESDECWVPAGWAIIGGDDLAPDAFPRLRVWVDAFIMRKFPVTTGEYLVFLDDLIASGREEEAHQHVPRNSGSDGAPVFVWRGDRYQIPDDIGSDFPVVLVDLHGARAYTSWLAARDRLGWRLPTEIEWEKAARGADGRYWPWGDHFEPAWARTVASLRPPRLGSVLEFPEDESPYGVRGLAGGVRDWTATAYTPISGLADGAGAAVHDEVGEHQVVKGGAWSSSGGLCRPAARFGNRPLDRFHNCGFRLVRRIDQ